MTANLTFPQSEFASSQMIFNKGDLADKFFIISSGEVEIFDPETKQKIALLKEGDAFGEQAILVGGVRAASAKAVVNTHCLEITTAKLKDMLQHEAGMLRPTIEALLLQLVMHNELKAAKALGGISKFEVSERFARSLMPSHRNNEEPVEELTKEQEILLGKELQKEKKNVLLSEGETLSQAYEELRKRKEEEMRLRAKRPKATEEPIESPFKMEELSAFLNSPEALKLPSKDLLFLKLLESEALGMTTIFTPEQRILSIGDIPSTAYLITSGEASQSSKNTGFCTLGPGSIIGLAEGFSDEPGQTSVIARTPIVARVIPINKATQAVRSSNKGLIGIARFTTMRILESEDPPSVFQ